MGQEKEPGRPAIIKNLLPQGRTNFDFDKSGKLVTTWSVQTLFVTGLLNVNKETIMMCLKPYNVAHYEAPGAVHIYWTLPAGFDTDTSLIHRINHVCAGYFHFEHRASRFDPSIHYNVLVSELSSAVIYKYPFSTLEVSSALACRLGFVAPLMSRGARTRVEIPLIPLHLTQPLTVHVGEPSQKYNIIAFHMPYNVPPTPLDQLLLDVPLPQRVDHVSVLWLGAHARRGDRLPLKKRLGRDEPDVVRLSWRRPSPVAQFRTSVSHLPDMASQVARWPPNVNATLTHLTLAFGDCNIMPRLPRKGPANLIGKALARFPIGSSQSLHPMSVLALDPHPPHHPVALKGCHDVVQLILKDAMGDVVTLASAGGEVSVCLRSTVQAPV